MKHFASICAAALLFVAAGCVKDNTSPTGTNPALTGNFVGYSNPDTKQTTCGNCHIDRQRDWQATKHANAWTDLQASGHASASCSKCHSTNGTSNLAPDTTGYFSVAASSQKYFEDVQCEACHGPGAAHITSPDETQPLASIHADTAVSNGCATCHTGTHEPFVDQWRQSGHGMVEPHANGNASCAGCHSGQGALARFDTKVNYTEKNNTTWEPIVCSVCHDPHGSSYPHQLRYPIATPDLTTNLCMQCHYRNANPVPSSSRGSHAPQGPMLLGEAGWIPPNFQYAATQQASTHGSLANPNLCVTCHMEFYDVTDQATGAFVLHSVGHLFRAIPCTDSTGAPIFDNSCPDTQRRFNACATGGCHATGAQALADRQVLTGRLQGQINVLWIDVNKNGVLDSFPTDSGLLAIVKKTTPGDFSTTGAGANTTTVGEGAWFNADLIQRGDGSFGVHNPIYAEALLLGSTQAVRAQYTYLPPAPPAQAAFERARMRAVGMKP